MNMPLITALLFLCAGLCALAVHPRPCAALRRVRPLRAADAGLSRLCVRLYVPLILLIAAAALFARLYALTAVPAGLSAEEALVGVEAKALLQTGGEAFSGALTAQLDVWRTSQTGPLLSALAVPFIALLGPTALAVRLPMALLHLLSAAAFYGLCRRVAGRAGGLCGLFLYALAPGLIMQSRWAYSAQALGPMLVIGLWLLAVSQRRRALYPVAMAVFGLATYACDAAWYVLPPFVLLLTVYALVSRRVAPRAALPGAALYLLLALPALLTLAVNTLDLPGFTLLGVQIPRFDAFEHAGKGPFAPYDALIRGSDAFDAMMDNGFSFVRQTLLQLPEEENVISDLFAMPNFGLYQLFMLPVAVLGGVACLVRLVRERGRAARPRQVIGVLAADGRDGAWALPCVACALLLLCMAGYGVLFRGLNAGHLSMALPLLILLCAQGVSFIARRVPLGGALLCAVYALGFGLFLSAYFAEYAPARTATTHYAGFVEAAAFADTLDVDEVHVTSNVYPHENPDMAVRVLTAFGFDLPTADLLGQTQGQTFAGRFSVFYPESQTIEPTPRTAYILRGSDAYMQDTSGFESRDFGDWCVLWVP